MLPGEIDTIRCITCVLPRTCSMVEFGEDGRCRLCREAPAKKAGPADTGESLERIIGEVRERGRYRPYDCVVGLSGGRDSSYLLFLLARRHGLRCLAAYYRTPFTHEVIDQNVRRLTAQLGIRVVEIGIPWSLHVKMARRYTLLWSAHPISELINLACAPCKLVNRDVYRIARAAGVRSLILGGNTYEEIQFLPAFRESDVSATAHSFVNQLLKVPRVIARGAGVLTKCPAALRNLPMSVKASVLYLSPHSSYLRMRYPDIQCVDYFFHTPYDEDACERTIRDELGWELPPGCLMSWRADCDFAEIKNLLFQQTTGATYTEAMLSNMVRAGKLSRQAALERLQGGAGISEERLRRALSCLDLPPDFADQARRRAGTKPPQPTH